MLAGTPATFVTPGITGGASEAYFLPADLDGSNLPPNGAPYPFVEFPSGGTYKTFHYHVDFATPGNSTFTQFGAPPAAWAYAVRAFGAGLLTPAPLIGRELPLTDFGRAVELVTAGPPGGGKVLLRP